MHRITTTICAIAALAWSASAEAAIVKVASGNGSPGELLVAGNIYIQSDADGEFSNSTPFSDTYSFLYQPPPELTNLASTTNLSLGTNYFINDFQFSWVGPAGSLVNQSGPGLFEDLLLQLTIPGTYTFTLSGTPRSEGGQYTFAMEVSAVPIPGALPLFASGLGLIGFLAMRRKRKALAPAIAA
jgi:hypothetical protein